MGLFVYILRSLRDGGLYVGQTNDLSRRLRQHNDPSGKSYTSKRGPWELRHVEECPDRASAMARERYLKSVAGSRTREAPSRSVPSSPPQRRWLSRNEETATRTLAQSCSPFGSKTAHCVPRSIDSSR